MPFDVQQYAAEKASGVRTATGMMPLKRLSGKHLRIVLLHVNGKKGYEIAEIMGMTGPRISNILNDPAVRAEIVARYKELDGEIFARSVQRVSEALDAGNPQQRTDLDGQVSEVIVPDHALRLRAADMVWKANGRYAEKPSQNATAEDIVQRMLALAGTHGGASVTVSAKVDVPIPVGETIEGSSE